MGLPDSSRVPAVVVQNVSKVYALYRRPMDRLLEIVSGEGGARHSDFHALRNVSLTVMRGEMAAFVGPNGSGKSTLLQLICGVLEPTRGRIRVNGRVASLLELGAGFNPELSGVENVRINAEVMGLSRAQIEEAFPRIEAFAGIGDFIRRPVKEYSSGMYVRLAFATAIHVEPEILIVDEALAVGDAVFSNKCIRKFEEFRKKGVTILFVSHDLGLVKQLADRAWFLNHGQVVAEGDPSDVVNRYIGMVLAPDPESALAADAPKQSRNNTEQSQDDTELRQNDAGQPEGSSGHSFRHGDGNSRIGRVELLNSKGNSTRTVSAGDRVQAVVEVTYFAATADPMVGILIRNRNGLDVFGTNTTVEQMATPFVHANETIQFVFEFVCRLPRNDYTLTVASQNADGSSQDWRDDVLAFAVSNPKQVAGLVELETTIQVRKLKRQLAATTAEEGAKTGNESES